MLRWTDLPVDERMRRALDDADAAMPSGERPLSTADRNDKKRWSEVFASHCATMIADALRSHADFKAKSILPDPQGGGQETFTPLGHQRGKRIDVVVAGELTGLEVGVSLKALNFPNAAGYHDHNVTGRLYELRDEVGLVHQYLPRAFMSALFFLPVQATVDKATSSFANTMTKLRQRTGRLDPDFVGHAFRCDSAAVALYVPGIEGDPFDRGVVRFFDVQDVVPPRRELPPAHLGLTIDDWVDHQVARVRERAGATGGYSKPEEFPGLNA